MVKYNQRPARRVQAKAISQNPAHWLLAALTVLGLLIAFAGQSFARSAPESFADLAEKLLPAVVNISTTQTIDSPHGQLPPGMPDFFRDFFERRGGQMPQQGPRPRQATSLGSGFVIDAGKGLVVTNNHVIKDADEIKVILQDNTTLDAELIGTDPKTDIALLKVDPKKHKLPEVSFGDSDKARVGDWVVAIGNPFGLGGSVTAGIISARGRNIKAGPYDDFIQTDASINKGNSGGPLFNMAGEVIGINTAIYSPSGGSVGIGFSVPSNLAKDVIKDIQEYGRTRRGWLGVRIQSVSEEIAENLGLSDARGALVTSVTEGGPAEKGGIKKGDVILTFDGKDVATMQKLPRIVAETNVDATVKVTLWRDGKEKTVRVNVGELELAEKNGSLNDGTKPVQTGSSNLKDLGLTLGSIDENTIAQFNLNEDSKGVVITAVDPDGPAAQKGVQPGELIVEVGQKEVTAPTDVIKAVEKAKKNEQKSVLLLIDGDTGLRFIAVKLTK